MKGSEHFKSPVTYWQITHHWNKIITGNKFNLSKAGHCSNTFLWSQLLWFQPHLCCPNMPHCIVTSCLHCVISLTGIPSLLTHSFLPPGLHYLPDNTQIHTDTHTYNNGCLLYVMCVILQYRLDGGLGVVSITCWFHLPGPITMQMQALFFLTSSIYLMHDI